MAWQAALAGGGGQAAGGIVGGILQFYGNRETNNMMEQLEYNYADYVGDLRYAFGGNMRGVSNDYLTMDFDRFGGLPEKQLGRYAAPMTGEQRSIIDSILSTRDQPRALNLQAEDQLHQVLGGQYLPGSGQENPYTQSLLDAIHRSSVRGLESQGPAMLRGLQGIAGGSLRGAGSAMPPISDFYGDWTQRAADAENTVLAQQWGAGRSDQMQALNWALGMPTGLETQRLGALLPVAEIERSIYDTAIQRAYADFARTQQLEAQRGQQAVSVMSQGAGPPSYPPIGAPPDFSGTGAAIGDALAAMGRAGQSSYNPSAYSSSPYAGAYNYGGVQGVGASMGAMQQQYQPMGSYFTPQAVGASGFNYGDASTYFGQTYPATTGAPTAAYGAPVGGYGGLPQGSLVGGDSSAWFGDQI